MSSAFMDDKNESSEVSSNTTAVWTTVTAVSSAETVTAVSSADTVTAVSSAHTVTALSSAENVTAVSSVGTLTAVSFAETVTAVSSGETVTAVFPLDNMTSVSLSGMTSQSSFDITHTERRLQVFQYTPIRQLVQPRVNISHSGNVLLGNKTKTDERAFHMKESSRSQLNSVDWRVYVETRAEERGVTLLKKNGVVIVVGCPGSGKTTLGLNMIKQIEQKEKIDFYIVTHHSNFECIPVSKDKPCIVLIDDIFGRSNIVLDFVWCWKQIFPELWSFVKEKRVRCIITLRKRIFIESIAILKDFDLFNENHLLDLQSDECCLNYYEKLDILGTYLEQKNITMDEDDKETVISCSCTELGFPQVCVYYVISSDAQKRGVKYFEKPVEYLTQQLENLKNDKASQINYLVLLLILFQQGSLSIDLLDPFENDSDSDIMKLVRLLERICQGVKNTDLTDIKKTADEMCGTYLKCSDNKYTFIHQSVFDSLFLMFSSEFPKKAAELLEMCPVSMLLEYVVTPGVCNKSHITMTVEPNSFHFLARRFTDFLASSNAEEIISHPSLKDEEFVKYLIKEKYFNDKLSEILHQRLHKHQNKYLCILSVNVVNLDEIFSNISRLLDNYSECSSYMYLDTDKHFEISSSVQSECIVKGLRILSRFFTENLCKMKLTNLKKELLNISCLFGDEDVVKMLLKSGVIPELKTLNAAASSKTDTAAILKELLQSKRNISLNEYSPLLLASIFSGNMKIACLLAEKINREKHNSVIKEKAIKLLLVRFHRQLRRESRNWYFGKSKTFEVVDVSHPFKKLVTIDIINKIKDIAIIAASQNTSGVIKKIVKLKPDCLNDENRDRVLLAAAVWGATDTVNFLIEQRRYDGDQNWKKSKVLKAAVMCNSADVVQCLLDKGADPNVNVAVNQKLIQLFEEEIEFKQLSVKITFKLLPSDTPLHISVLRGDLDIIKSLIKRNADVNAVNSKGETPLHEAVNAVKNRKEVALLLLENGADTNIKDDYENSALHIASEIAKDVVKEVIKKGAEINAINSEQKTPLHVSLICHRPEIALYLLSQGCDPYLTDSDNNYLLHLATKYGNVEIVTALIEKGADVNCKDMQGETPLIIFLKYTPNKVDFFEDPAISSDKTKVALALLKHGADTNLADNDNNSVLHLAAKHGNVEIMTALIEKGVDVNVRNMRGKTPLFTAVKFQHYKILLYLLKERADPNLRDNDKNSVLHLAIEHGNLEIVTALIENGVDVNVKNSLGETPLDKAKSYRREIVSYLLEHGAKYSNINAF